jgi:beta-phosphoglucomutase-like phosphatase (HAD superfamily)
MVTSEDVSRGKPFPDPYLEGAMRCGVPVVTTADGTSSAIVPGRTVLVVEDAPSGIKSGKAAGAKTLAVLTSTTKEKMQASGAEPDFIVNDLTS